VHKLDSLLDIMWENKINNYITLKLEDEITQIYGSDENLEIYGAYFF